MSSDGTFEIKDAETKAFEEHLSTPLPNDVRIVFPRDGGCSLWASRAVLSSASEYFKTSFKSGCSEANVESSRDTKAIGSTSPTPSELHNLKYSTITVTEASIRTYRSVLCWIYTSYVDFSPLLSTFAADASAERTSLLSAFLEKFASENPSLPLPSSPKSVYRLAHYLEISDLKDLALANLKRQLAPDNIAVELFSETSGRYKEVLEVMVEFAVAQTREMKESAGWKAMMASGVGGDRARGTDREDDVRA